MPAALYRKKKVTVGYVKATDLFPEGEEIVIRMLEGGYQEDRDSDAVYYDRRGRGGLSQ